MLVGFSYGSSLWWDFGHMCALVPPCGASSYENTQNSVQGPYVPFFFIPTNPLSRKLSNKWHQLDSELARSRSLHYIFLVKKKMQTNKDHTFLLGHMCTLSISSLNDAFFFVKLRRYIKWYFYTFLKIYIIYIR